MTGITGITHRHLFYDTKTETSKLRLSMVEYDNFLFKSNIWESDICESNIFDLCKYAIYSIYSIYLNRIELIYSNRIYAYQGSIRSIQIYLHQIDSIIFDLFDLFDYMQIAILCEFMRNFEYIFAKIE